MQNLQKKLNLKAAEELRKAADWLEKDFIAAVEIETSAVDPKYGVQSIKLSFTRKLKNILNAKPEDI